MKRADCTHSNVTVVKAGPEVEKGRCDDCGAILYRYRPHP